MGITKKQWLEFIRMNFIKLFIILTTGAGLTLNLIFPCEPTLEAIAKRITLVFGFVGGFLVLYMADTLKDPQKKEGDV
jgi:hypothetical protein